MGTTTADLILHPVRMRIVQAFAGGNARRQLTSQQLVEALPDVPQASLYRHVARLAVGGVLQVVEQRPVRGSVERVYALAASPSELLGPEDLAGLSREAHFQHFATFLGCLLGDFARYLERDRVDLAADGVAYRQAVLHLSDTEFARLRLALAAAFEPFLALDPAPERRRRLLSTIVMPAAEWPRQQGEDSE